ncbi:MAG: hypothetical protein ABEJ72_05940, partial [Candidatus Aenigmatarchaeota archaeon]
SGSATSNPYVSGSIVSAAPLSVLGAAGVSGYLGKKFDSFTSKVYSTAMAAAPTAKAAKNYVSGTPGDMATLASLTGIDGGALLAGSAAMSAGMTAYNWSDEIKDMSYEAVDSLYGAVDSFKDSIYNTVGSDDTFQEDLNLSDEIDDEAAMYADDLESSLGSSTPNSLNDLESTLDPNSTSTPTAAPA